MDNNKLNKGFLSKVSKFAVVILCLISLGMSWSAMSSVYGSRAVQAMTETQRLIDDFIADIMSDRTLTDGEKAMLVQCMRTFTTDCITSMDDAMLLIDRLLKSNLLTDEDITLLEDLKAMIESGEITDLGMVKSILSNVLLRIKNDIASEKSPTFIKLEDLALQIKNDPTITENQRGMFLDIIYSILDEDLEMVGVNDKESVKALITTLLENDLITDTSTYSTLEKIQGGLDSGKDYNMNILKGVLEYAFKQMLGDESYDASQKALLEELADKYTNINDGYPEFTDIKDAEKFLEILLNSGLVTDAHIIRDMESVLTMLYGGKEVDLDTANEVILRALENIKINLLTEKISVLTGKDIPDGVDPEEYYKQIIARFTSSQFNYLETLALANKADIEKLAEAIDQNMILSDEQRQLFLDSLGTYNKGGDDTLGYASEALQRAIDRNGDMDSKTKAGLITMINSVDDNSKTSVRELRDKLQEKINELGEDDKELKKDLEDIIKNLDEKQRSNYNALKNDLKKLEKDTNDDFDETNIAIASVRKDLAESNSSDALAMAAIRTDLSALDRKTANEIKDLAEDTEDRVETLRAETNQRIQNLSNQTGTNLNDLEDRMTDRIDDLETDTNTKIDNLDQKVDDNNTATNTKIDNLEADTNTKIDDLTDDMNDKFADMESDTDAKINTLRNETNTALALLRSDLEDVEQSVVDTNEAMANMNETLIARDEDMKTAIGESLLASFTNVETLMTTLISNTEGNFNAMYVDLNTKIRQQYLDNKTNYNNMKNDLGMQTDYTLTTGTSGEPLIIFTPHGDGFDNYTATDPGNATKYNDLVKTDAPTDTYEEPEYTNP